MAEGKRWTQKDDEMMRRLVECTNTPEFREALNERFREQSVPENGVCRKPECGGRIVKAVCSLSCYGYGYGTPYCPKCGREYPMGGAEHAITVGMEAFQRMLNTPFDI